MEALAKYVPEILKFGFLGLSFLMLFLGYRTMQTVIGDAKPTPAKFELCRFFLVISVIFMVLAGPLQFGLLYFQDKMQDKSVVLYIGVPNAPWEVEFGDIRMSYRDKPFISILGKTVKQEFSENDRINIDVSSLLGFIFKLRDQVQAAVPHSEDQKMRVLEGG